MLNVSGVAINFDGQNLFSNVNLQFLPGNCYGIIGANGAGKSTFLRILSGDLEPSKGEVSFDPKYRMSVLKQDHFAYEEQSVFETIMQGNARLYEISVEKDALYAKPDFSEEDVSKTGKNAVAAVPKTATVQRVFISASFRSRQIAPRI